MESRLEGNFNSNSNISYIYTLDDEEEGAGSTRNNDFLKKSQTNSFSAGYIGASGTILSHRSGSNFQDEEEEMEYSSDEGGN